MKFVLDVSAAGAQLWAKSPQGWQLHPGPASGPVWVLTNLAEEGFADIHVPRLFGRDRQAFITRQLASRFADSPYRTTLPPAPAHRLMDYLAPPHQIALGLDDGKRLDAALADVSAPLVGVWASSMLLGVIGRKRPLPRELFVVLPCAQALRIVVLKDRVPVLSRLIPEALQPPGQVAEIVRTLRHLENTRVLSRLTEPRGVLVLGDASGLADLLAPEHLYLAALPSHWSKVAPADWRFALFDLVLASPAGQLAPLPLRTKFIAARLQRAAYVGAALGLVLSVGLVASNARALLASRATVSQLQGQLQVTAARAQEVERTLSGFGVPAELVRQASALARDEIQAVRPFAEDLRQLGQIMSQFEPLRLSQLSWQLLPPTELACAGELADATARPDESAPTETDEPRRQVEIKFEILVPDALGERARADLLSRLSARLSQLQGASLRRDPAQLMAHAPLSGGGARVGGTAPQSWCLALPGQRLAQAPTVHQP